MGGAQRNPSIPCDLGALLAKLGRRVCTGRVTMGYGLTASTHPTADSGGPAGAPPRTPMVNTLACNLAGTLSGRTYACTTTRTVVIYVHLLIVFCAMALLAPLGVHAKSATELFESVSNSIVVVVGKNGEGKSQAA